MAPISISFIFRLYYTNLVTQAGEKARLSYSCYYAYALYEVSEHDIIRQEKIEEN